MVRCISIGTRMKQLPIQGPTAHLAKCPTELLSLIGEFLEANSYHLVSFSQVCRKTRNAIIQNPFLWTFIKLENYPHRATPPDMFDTFLDRARDLPLDVEISLSPVGYHDYMHHSPPVGPRMRRMLDRLYACAPRWRSLTINEYDSPVMIARHLFDTIEVFPRLVRLNLVACKYIASGTQPTRHLLPAAAPALVWLNFCRTSPLQFVKLLTNVTVLILDDVDRYKHRFHSLDGLDLDLTFIRALNAAQSLTSLRLHEDVVQSLPWTQKPLVELPSLKHLALVGRRTPNFFRDCLSNFAPWSLHSLSIYYVSTHISARNTPTLDLDDLPNIDDYSSVTALAVINVQLVSVGSLDIRHYVTGQWRWDSPCISSGSHLPPAELFPNLDTIVVLNRSDDDVLKFCKDRVYFDLENPDVYFPRRFVKDEGSVTRNRLSDLTYIARVQTFALPDLSAETALYETSFLDMSRFDPQPFD